MNKLFLYLSLLPLVFSSLCNAENYRLDSSPTTQEGYVAYFAPLQIREYNSSLEDIVHSSINRIRGWNINIQENNIITIKLDNYKGNNVEIKIEKVGDNLTLTPIADSVTGCKGSIPQCSVADGHYYKWMNNLRRHLARTIQEEALAHFRKKNT